MVGRTKEEMRLDAVTAIKRVPVIDDSRRFLGSASQETAR